jgi:hypothetical protein
LAILLVTWTGRITGGRIDQDGGHTLTMAVNLAHSGVISLKTAPPLEPSMYREPLPVVVAAGAVLGIDAVHGRAPLAAYFEGPRARLVKVTNVAWMLLLCASVYVAVHLLTGSRMLGFAGAILVNLPLPLVPSGFAGLGLDSLNSDLPAAALLAGSSVLLAAGLSEARVLRCVVAGVMFGALALVKASFVYVFAGLAVSVFLLAVIAARRDYQRPVARNGLVLTVCFAAVVAPWMLRNHNHFGTWSIAERGGVVLLIRAEKDQMTAEEYRGAFYAWAPYGIRPAFGRLLGFEPRDLHRGGRLQRLNRYPSADFHADDVAAERAGRPDLAISYYRRARAQRVQLNREIGATLGSLEVDRRLQERALDMIAQHPWRHLAVTVPVLWRGAFMAFPVLVLGLAAALRRRDLRLATFLWPSMGLALFYGLLSHFIPRYGVPLVPVAIVVALTVASQVLGTRRATGSLAGPHWPVGSASRGDSR